MKKIIDLQGLTLKDLLFLNKMISPIILTVIYWLSIVGVVFLGLSVIFNSFSLLQYRFFEGLVCLIGGILTILIGSISVRISFELVCVIFNINRNLEKLVVIQSGSDNSPSTPEKIGAAADANIHIKND